MFEIVIVLLSSEFVVVHSRSILTYFLRNLHCGGLNFKKEKDKKKNILVNYVSCH